MSIDWSTYEGGHAYDELVNSAHAPRLGTETLFNFLATLNQDGLRHRQTAAEHTIQNLGITFTIYSQGENIDRAWPFDIIPRTIPYSEWQRIEEGLVQRVCALNLFIHDLYHDQKIIKDGIFPADVLAKSVNFRQQCIGAIPKYNIWAHICGSDLVRDDSGTIYVLEDNLRVPSGVSYMLENRMITKRVFPDLFHNHNILPVDNYPAELHDMMMSLSPRTQVKPSMVVLTPGIYNSAYFEHAYLARQMGVDLVEGKDLIVGSDDCVYMKTVFGPRRVDVIYRRVDDLFLDPEAFNPNSTLGVNGLIRAWKKGTVALVNAPGAGVADDKVVYAFVPEIINYYLKQDPLIPNVPTYKCMIPSERDHVLKNLDKLVVKPANESGGYGMLIGPHSTQAERDQFAGLIQKDPRNYIAQPTLTLSTVPTVVNDTLEPRHVDLRPFILQGARPYVTPGGLTRVAMRKGSLVVNSSQGGGSKDTWIIQDTP
ncbi:MAG: circularly permuted type 2 ATP-grasp protein [Magnetococcales bacterium]|nr:circularly permuted type 2 ATP-grasp protein [Magnetococcales bacterium]